MEKAFPSTLNLESWINGVFNLNTSVILVEHAPSCSAARVLCLEIRKQLMICTHSTSFHLLTRPFPGTSESEDIAKNNVLGTRESENIVQHHVFAFALTSPGALALLQAKMKTKVKYQQGKTGS